MKYQLEISNITKSYGDLKANDDVSLSIKSSSIHALLGENGAGKSTLVKIIYGSLMPIFGQTMAQSSLLKLSEIGSKPWEPRRLT